MVFRPPYPYPMYPGGMRMPMPMQTPPQMSPQSFFPPGGFPVQPRIPGGFPMANGIGSFGGQMPMPPVQEASKVGSFYSKPTVYLIQPKPIPLISNKLCRW